MSDLSCADDLKFHVWSSSQKQQAGPASSTAAATAPTPGGRRTARKLFRSSRIHHKRKHGTSTAPPPCFLGGSGGSSEEVFESSLESIDSTNNSWRPSVASSGGAALSPNKLAFGYGPGNGGGGGGGGDADRRHLEKIASADSLLAMIRAGNAQLGQQSLPASTPSSPQLSDGGGGCATPLTTPDTPPTAFGSPAAVHQSIKVEVYDHPDSDSDHSPGTLSPSSGPNAGAGATATAAGAAAGGSSLMLEVPSGFLYGKCLSPIKELPSPLPTPATSPLLQRATSPDSQSTSSASSSATTSSRRSSFRRSYRKKKEEERQRELEKERLQQQQQEEEDGEDDGENDEDLDASHAMPIPFRRRYSYAGDGATVFRETSFVVPPLKRAQSTVTQQSVTSTRPPILPTITFTVHEEEPSEEEGDHQQERPAHNSEPDDSMHSGSNPKRVGKSRPMLHSTRSLRSPRKSKSVSESQLPTNIVIPQVLVSFDETPEASNDATSPNAVEKSLGDIHKSPGKSNNTSMKWRPPPINIPNSTFRNFFSSKNETKDTESKPKVEIELKEIATTPQKKAVTPEVTKEKPEEDVVVGEVTKELSEEVHVAASSETGGSSDSLKKLLVKQKEPIDEELDDDVDNDNDVLSPLIPKLGSPKFLLAPDSFDSTPRSRSQSVELPELRLKDSQSPPSPNSTSQCSKPTQPTHAAPMPARRGSRDERLALLLRQHQRRHDEAPAAWGGVRLGSPPMCREVPLAGKAQKMLLLRSALDQQNATTQMGAAMPQITVTAVGDHDDEDSSRPETEGEGVEKIKPLSRRRSSGSMHYLNPLNAATTCSSVQYLSPFAAIMPGTAAASCSSRTTSESNLSSSGYSSMTSPGEPMRPDVSDRHIVYAPTEVETASKERALSVGRPISWQISVSIVELSLVFLCCTTCSTKINTDRFLAVIRLKLKKFD